MKLQMKTIQGSLSPTVLCKVKIRRHTAFGVNDSIQFQQQNCAHQLEIMPNLNAILSTLYSIKRSMNLLAHKLLIKFGEVYPL